MMPVRISLSLIRKYPILIGALLLAINSVSAGLDELDETGASGSSSETGQRVRELGRPLYRTFTRKDEGIVNKILTGVQDPRGLMIFGSVNCVLEYDGQRWTSIPIPNSGHIEKLACDKSGKIYVGASGELGVLVLEGGIYRYKSYTSLLPASAQHLGEIRDIAVRGDDVYFLFEKSLLRWAGQQFSVIRRPFLGAFLSTLDINPILRWSVIISRHSWTTLRFEKRRSLALSS